MNTYDYLHDHFEELARFCPGLTFERVLQGAVRLITVAGEPRGFISLEPTSSSLRIIALFIEQGAPKALVERVVEMVVGYAEDLGVQKIEFDTTRKGWSRRLRRYGFKPLPYYRMSRRVTNG